MKLPWSYLSITFVILHLLFLYLLFAIFFSVFTIRLLNFIIYFYILFLTILNSAFSFGKLIDECLFYNDRNCLNILHICNNLSNTVENIAPPRWYRQSIRQPQFLCVCGAFKSSFLLFLRAWDMDPRVRSSVSWPFASEIAKQCRRSRGNNARANILGSQLTSDIRPGRRVPDRIPSKGAPAQTTGAQARE